MLVLDRVRSSTVFMITAQYVDGMPSCGLGRDPDMITE